GDTAAEAVAEANKRGISTAHYDMIYLRPVDESILKEIGQSGIPVITVEDGSVKGGLGSTVLEWLSDNGFNNRVTRIGTPASRFVTHGKVSELHSLCGMDADSILKAIINANNPKR
ncbi:MAG: 1-deoxy-D-xylulose-5-phosphate synthase, partial [Paramuribaculum sp.]|nr:1-deoxy-D-xylulose-5-phosphate synthase [Paramuribaculum sp.]